MKTKINPLNFLLLIPVIIWLVLLAFSCNQRYDNTSDTRQIAERENEARFDRRQERDADFLADAALINLTEIKLAQLAQSKATNERVKEFARTMEDEHQRMYSEIGGIAERKSISIPAAIDEDGTQAYNRLNDKTGKNFDDEYCDLMVRKHRDAIDRFERASTRASDPDIANLALSALPKLRTHLDHAKALQEESRKIQ